MKLRLERKPPYRLQIVEADTVIHELPLGNLSLIHTLKGLIGFTPFCLFEGTPGGIFDGRDSEWVIWHSDEEQHGKGLLHITVNEDGEIEDEDDSDDEEDQEVKRARQMELLLPQFFSDEEGRIVDEDGVPLVDDETMETLRQLLRPRRISEPAGDSVVDEAAATEQFNDLLEQALKVNWVNLYHDATTGNLLPGHELCMEAGTDPTVILRPKFWNAAAKPDNASWLKQLGGDPSAKPSENLAQINAVFEAFGIKKDKLSLLASIYPIHADLKAWWDDFARRHLRK